MRKLKNSPLWLPFWSATDHYTFSIVRYRSYRFNKSFSAMMRLQEQILN